MSTLNQAAPAAAGAQRAIPQLSLAQLQQVAGGRTTKGVILSEERAPAGVILSERRATGVILSEE